MLRTNATWRAPDTRRSSRNVAWPRSRRGSSRRLRGCPENLVGMGSAAVVDYNSGDGLQGPTGLPECARATRQAAPREEGGGSGLGGDRGHAPRVPADPAGPSPRDDVRAHQGVLDAPGGGGPGGLARGVRPLAPDDGGQDRRQVGGGADEAHSARAREPWTGEGH